MKVGSLLRRLDDDEVYIIVQESFPSCQYCAFCAVELEELDDWVKRIKEHVVFNLSCPGLKCVSKNTNLWRVIDVQKEV